MLKKTEPRTKGIKGYNTILSDVAGLLESARRMSARAINAIMTATYWEIGRRIVEFEVGGRGRADYGKQLIDRLSEDLTAKFGRGFGRSNLFQMRAFYLAFSEIVQTASGQSKPIPQVVSAKSNQITFDNKSQTPSGQLSIRDIANKFPLPWSHYVLLLIVKNPEARVFYETEALRGGWSGA